MRFQQNYRSRGADFRYWGADRGRPPFRPRGQMPPTRGFGVAPMTRQQAFSSPYCRICHITGQPDSVVRSHRIGDMACPKLSEADKAYIQQQRDQPRINAIDADESTDSLADVYGYDDSFSDQQLEDHQVSQSTLLLADITSPGSNPTYSSCPLPILFQDYKLDKSSFM